MSFKFFTAGSDPDSVCSVPNGQKGLGSTELGSTTLLIAGPEGLNS